MVGDSSGNVYVYAMKNFPEVGSANEEVRICFFSLPNTTVILQIRDWLIIVLMNFPSSSSSSSSYFSLFRWKD